MGCRILAGTQPGGTFPLATLYCSCTDWAFGPVFYGDDARGLSAIEEAEAFIAWLEPRDPREIPLGELEVQYSAFRDRKEEVSKKED